jgi:TatD DNase family protein
MLIDSHCHLTDGRFDADRGDVLAAAVTAGVTGVVTIASDAADASAVAELVRAHAPGPGGIRLWGTAGIHPHEAEAATDGDLDQVRALAEYEAGIVAIGETGLDFHYDHSPRAVQLRLFEAQLQLAADLALPAVVHSRDADRETIAVLENLPAGVRGVLHCFTGGPELLEAGLDAGWFVSFSGIASFKKFDAAHLLRAVPDDRLLVETDAPYLAPVPYRGKRNEPAMVRHVVQAVAEHRSQSPDAVATSTADNALRFYGLGADAAGDVGA